MTLVPLDEVLDRRGYIAQLQVAPAAQFVSNVLGNVLRPTLRRVERDYADGMAVLAFQQGGYSSFQVCVLAIGFNVRPTQQAKVVLDNIYRLIGPIRHNGRRPSGRTHPTLHNDNSNFDFKAHEHQFVPEIGTRSPPFDWPVSLRYQRLAWRILEISMKVILIALGVSLAACSSYASAQSSSGTSAGHQLGQEG
jgi:hypothetical protein